MSQSKARSTCECKLCRVGSRYEIADLDQFLRRLREEEDSSLRDIAEKVNIYILQQCLESSNVSIAGDPTSIYHALQNEDSDRFYNIQIKLNEAQITDPFYAESESDQTSVDRLLDDFVSYQTVRKHLQNALEMDTGRSGVTSIQEGREVIRDSQDRHTELVARMLNRLNRDEVDAISITPDALDISQSTRVRCHECSSSFSLEQLLNNGGCDCQ